MQTSATLSSETRQPGVPCDVQRVRMERSGPYHPRSSGQRSQNPRPPNQPPTLHKNQTVPGRLIHNLTTSATSTRNHTLSILYRFKQRCIDTETLSLIGFSQIAENYRKPDASRYSMSTDARTTQPGQHPRNGCGPPIYRPEPTRTPRRGVRRYRPQSSDN